MLDKAAIYALMSDLHQSMETYLASASPGPALSVPERSYVTLGEVADDEEQLVTAARRIYFGPVDTEALRALRMAQYTRTVVLEVRFIMCAVTQDGENPPAPEDLEANAAEVLEWGVAIGNALINAHKSGIFEACQDVALGPSVPIGPVGGYVGFSQEVRCQL